MLLLRLPTRRMPVEMVDVREAVQVPVEVEVAILA
jgi:hypothetical protein